jgi:hypothetical protein
LQWGDKLEFLQNIEKSSGETPPALLNRPILSQFEQPYYIAFQVLSESRRWTPGGPAMIPLSEIYAYFKIYEIKDLDEREEYLIYINRLDLMYVKSINKRNK